jgi:hypothetical protein
MVDIAHQCGVRQSGAAITIVSTLADKKPVEKNALLLQL